MISHSFNSPLQFHTFIFARLAGDSKVTAAELRGLWKEGEVVFSRTFTAKSLPFVNNTHQLHRGRVTLDLIIDTVSFALNSSLFTYWSNFTSMCGEISNIFNAKKDGGVMEQGKKNASTHKKRNKRNEEIMAMVL